MEVGTIFLLVLVLTIVLLLTVVTYVIYSGLFYRVQVGAGKPVIQNLLVAYKFGRGPYRDTGYVFTEVTSIAPKQRCVGIYYDDPNQVPAHKLRWAVGSILCEGAETPDPAVTALYEEKGFKLFRLPQVSNVVRTSFPERTSLSVLIGIFKVYPLLGEYVRINKLCAHPWMEVYDGKTIYYMAPLAKQDEFYVPESLDDGYGADEEDDDVMEAVPEEAETELNHTSDVELTAESRCEIGQGDGAVPGPGVDGQVKDTATAADKLTQSQENGAVKGSAKQSKNGSVSNGTAAGQSEQASKASVGETNDSAVNGDAATVINNGQKDKEAEVNAKSPAPKTKSSSKDKETVKQKNATDKINDSQSEIQNDGVSSSTAVDPPSPASSALSESSRTSTERESSSASYYTSQSERSYSTYPETSQSERSSSSYPETSQSERSYSSYPGTTATEFSSDSDGDTETDVPPLSPKDETRVS